VTTAGVVGTPIVAKIPTKARMAKRKFVSGPAATMMKRCQTGLAWKVWLRSSGGSSSHSLEGWLAGFMSPLNFT
jgi:hypothetical protein